MRKILFLLLIVSLSKLQAQTFSGQVFMRENASLYLNQVYVTNLTEQKTVLSNYNGEFQINAKAGDVIRFTSIISERKDIQLTNALLGNSMNLVELKPGYYEIKEVIIGWKPSGNLKKDVLSLKHHEKEMKIAAIIGLPQPKSHPQPAAAPLAAFQGGGLSFSLSSLYDLLSGEHKKKQRLYEYERMQRNVTAMKDYFGEAYFTNIKIPKNMIDNFLQFVYASDNIALLIENQNLEATAVYIEKYLPIYQKRLRHSNLTQIAN